MKQFRVFLSVGFVLFLPILAFGQANQTISPNGCQVEDLDPRFFRWTQVGASPVGPPITDYQMLREMLELQYDPITKAPMLKPWQRFVSEEWRISMEVLVHLAEIARTQPTEVDVQSVMVEPCATFVDMTYGDRRLATPQNPYGPITAIGRTTMFDPANRMPARAWMYRIDDPGNNRYTLLYFIAGCANPAYRTVTYAQKDEQVPPNPITISLDKTNDANQDGVFSDLEESASASSRVSFRYRITNTTVVAAGTQPYDSQIDMLVDNAPAFGPGQQLNICPHLIGTRLAPGQTVSCIHTFDRYSPAAGGKLVNTATVVVFDVRRPGLTTVAMDESTVTTAPLPPPPIPPPPPQDLCANFEGIQTAVPAGFIRDEAGNCNPPPPPIPPPPPVISKTIIVPCPVVEVDPYAVWQSRVFGAFLPRNLWETGVSVAGGAGGAYGFSTVNIRNEQAVKSAVASFAAKVVLEAINPDKTRVRVKIAGKDAGNAKRGENKMLNGGIARVEWQKNTAKIYVMVNGMEGLCGSGSVDGNVNLTPIPIIKRLEIRYEQTKPPGMLVPRP